MSGKVISMRACRTVCCPHCGIALTCHFPLNKELGMSSCPTCRGKIQIRNMSGRLLVSPVKFSFIRGASVHILRGAQMEWGW